MTELEQANRRIAQLEEQLAKVMLQLEWFKKRFLGTGKSERQDALQLQLQLEELKQATEASLEQEKISYERRKSRNQAQRQLPEERFGTVPERETVEIIPDEVKAAPEEYRRIGEEETFEIDIDPPKLFKRRIVRPKFVRMLQPDQAPLVARAPKRVIDGSYASPGLIAWVVVAKYVDHLPLYRQEKMFSRYQVSIPRQRMCDWVGKAAELLEVVYWRIKEGLISGGYLQADETPIQFNDPDQKKGKTSKGFFWFLSKPEACVFVHWDQSRSKQVANDLLKGFNGILQTDGYEGYHDFKSGNKKVDRVACLAHCRRKFSDALGADPVRARFILRLIGHLYNLEEKWDQQDITDPIQRAHLRKRDFATILSLLKRSLVRILERVRPTSKLGEACQYMLGQWDDLVKVLKYGQVKLDNNLVENVIRPSAVGKKNWLFIGAPDAGKRSAIMYTLILSCYRFGIDPCHYLRDVLSRLPTMTNQSDLTPLLPSHWKPA